MRQPIRLKNLNLRFAPWYLLGAVIVALAEIRMASIAIGAVPIILGLALRSWGAGHLIKNDRFTVSGPYAHVRHPLYLGTVLVSIGFAMILGGVYSLLVLAIVLPWFFLSYFPRKEATESARLRERYGEAYERYREEVPALVPRIAPWRPEAPALAEGGVRWQLSCWDANNEHGTLLAGLALLFVLAARAALG